MILPMIGCGQNINIPDANFKAVLVKNPSINTNGDTEIQVSEAAAYTAFINCTYWGISDLTGIEYFTALADLDCSNNKLTTLDVSNNIALTYLSCNGNQLTTLDVSNNTALESLYCDNNNLTSLDVSGATRLHLLFCSDNQLTSLDVSNNLELSALGCFKNKFDCDALKKKGNDGYNFE